MMFLVTLAVVWFFLYWIIGGVFFACVALLKLIRLRKVRFSCLFSLSAALCALAAAWGSVKWLENTAATCPKISARGAEAVGEIFTCGFLQLAVSALAGLAVLIFIGFGLLKLSSWKDRTWLTTFADRLELNNNNDNNEE